MIEMPVAFISPSMGEMVILGIIGVLVFGKDLPAVGRTLGRSVMQLRRSLQGLQDEFNFSDRPSSSKPRSASKASSNYNPIDDRDEAVAPKFEPPKAQPTEQTPAASSAE